jgi:hypothetical protein
LCRVFCVCFLIRVCWMQATQVSARNQFNVCWECKKNLKRFVNQVATIMYFLIDLFLQMKCSLQLTYILN